jgi:hypothetical protein
LVAVLLLPFAAFTFIIAAQGAFVPHFQKFLRRVFMSRIISGGLVPVATQFHAAPAARAAFGDVEKHQHISRIAALLPPDNLIVAVRVTEDFFGELPLLQIGNPPIERLNSFVDEAIHTTG